MTRLARTDFVLDRHARDHQESYGFGVFAGAVGTIAAGTTYGTHIKHDYGMPWPIPPLLYASIVLLVACCYLRYRCTFAAWNVQHVSDGRDHYGDEQSALSSVLHSYRQIQNPKDKQLARDLLHDIEVAARVMEDGKPSAEETALMTERYKLMYRLEAEDLRMRQEIRMQQTTDRHVIDRVASEIDTRKELAA